MTGPLTIKITNDPMYMENGYTVHFGPGRPCWLIDPGLPPQGSQILSYIESERLSVDAIVLTHAHADHIGGVDEVRDALGDIPVYLAEEEWAALTDPRENLSIMSGVGFSTKVVGPHPLAHGASLELDGSTWQVLDVAGHSPGGRAFYCAAEKLVICGDALFNGSIGRTDFHHSNHDQLLQNIQANLYALPDETRVLSGHGPETTVGHEKATNPFVRG
ncbi:MAG: MBL fold metallo-hydrolase [Phycisphaerae bacterium]